MPEFDPRPIDEVISDLEERIAGLDPNQPSDEAVSAINDIIEEMRSRLGNMSGDEFDVDTSLEDRLDELQERVHSLAPAVR